MPIKIERHLALLAAAEALSQGLSKARGIVERERGSEASPEEALGNIDLLLRPEFLVEDLPDIRALLLFERKFYSEARVKAAKRQRNHQRSRRLRQLRHQPQEEERNEE